MRIQPEIHMEILNETENKKLGSQEEDNEKGNPKSILKILS